ncbi:MAG TPA: hypothetical protein VKV03_13730 [Candidatus Binataceae bacterium]|nr:hypothetical protein [Candidatus Binataceae bacterium]
MSDIANDSTLMMPGLSMACLEALGATVLSVFQPSALKAPRPVDIVGWIDRILPRFGVHVTPAGESELGDCAALTIPSSEFECEILIREWMWKDLTGEPRPNFARATVMHELAHAILHVPTFRDAAALEHAQPGTMVPAFRDPEWQAWALAGAILMPRKTLAMLAQPHPVAVAQVYIVSAQFAQAHLKRLKLFQETSHGLME